MKTLLLALVILLALLQAKLWRGEGSLTDIQRLDREIAAQRAANQQLQKRNEALLQEVNDLRNGLDSIEERARNELGLIKKGETFYLIPDDGQTSAAP
ncbi:MAG: cell division protein FtsB [Pseudomonadales bacterium]|jgi:cell division protein FtsB|nr:cell division protein FtsB [Pseudomonadales bacterium]